MFYDDYGTLFNPRKAVSISAKDARSRLWKAARERGFDLDEWAVSRSDVARVDGVIADALSSSASAAAPAAVPARKVKGDMVGVKALTPRALATFLSDACMERKDCRIAVQRVGDEEWVGIVAENTFRKAGETYNILLARLPASAEISVGSALRTTKRKDGVEYAIRSLKDGGYKSLSKYITEEAPDDMVEAWDALRDAWSNHSRGAWRWTHLTLSLAARGATTFCADKGESRYGLYIVAWDNAKGFDTIPVPPLIGYGIRPLTGYPGVFTATDGSRAAIIGVNAAPGDEAPATGVQIPRALFDNCDPAEAYGYASHIKKRRSGMAMGPFLSYGEFSEFPSIREVLPRSYGAAVSLNGADMEAFDLPPKSALGRLQPHELVAHATVYTRGVEDPEDTRRLDVLVRYVPQGGSPRDYRAFPAKRVGRFPVYVEGKKSGEEALEPHGIQALFVSETMKSLRAAGEASVRVTMGAPLFPILFIGVSQYHIIMPVRLEKEDVERAYQSADGGAGPVTGAVLVEDFSYYPEGTVGQNVAGSSYKALWSALTKGASKYASSDVFVYPVEGPDGPETWLHPSSTAAFVRLPGALVDTAYHANDKSKTDALLAQIFRAPRVPAFLSPGDSPKEEVQKSAYRLAEVDDATVGLPERQVDVDGRLFGAAAMFLPDAKERHGQELIITDDGTLSVTNGYAALYARKVVAGMPKGGPVKLSPALVHELYEGNAGVLSVGDKVLAAGRLASTRPLDPTLAPWDGLLDTSGNEPQAKARLTFNVAEATKELRALKKEILALDTEGMYYTAPVSKGRAYLASFPANDAMKPTGLNRENLLETLEAAKRLGWTTATLYWSAPLKPMFLRVSTGANLAGRTDTLIVFMPHRLD